MRTDRQVCAWLAAAVLMAGVAGARAQNTAKAEAPANDLRAALASGALAQTLRLGDLNADWLRVRTAGGGIGGEVRALIGISSRGGGDTFYTKFETFAFGGETFLVAYRLPGREAFGRRGDAPAADNTTVDSETRLVLVLLNLGALQGLGDIRPFSLDQEIAEAQAAADAMRAMMDRARQFGDRAGGPGGPGGGDGRPGGGPPRMGGGDRGSRGNGGAPPAPPAGP